MLCQHHTSSTVCWPLGYFHLKPLKLLFLYLQQLVLELLCVTNFHPVGPHFALDLMWCCKRTRNPKQERPTGWLLKASHCLAHARHFQHDKTTYIVQISAYLNNGSHLLFYPFLYFMARPSALSAGESGWVFCGVLMWQIQLRCFKSKKWSTEEYSYVGGKLRFPILSLSVLRAQPGKNRGNRWLKTYLWSY